MREFVYTSGASNKFWNIDLQGSSFTVHYGRVGTKGQTQTKTFPNEPKARAAYEKLVGEKVGKGYVEQVAAAPPPSPLLQALEDALVANPDDVAAHSARADYLMEQGDPRGEFAQAQLALENPQLTGAERARLEERAAALEVQYARQWLGDPGRFLVGKWSGEDKPYHYQFARGWPDHIRVLPVPEGLTISLANAPEMRLLRRLEVVYDMRFHPFEFDEFTDEVNKALKPGERDGELHDNWDVLPHLVASPHLTNLRVFKFGFSDSEDQVGHSTMVQPFGTPTAEQILAILKQNPRLDELYLNVDAKNIADLFSSAALGQLRVFQYYFGTEYTHHQGRTDPYPLSRLAENESLKDLTTLRLHPGREATIALDELNALLRSPNLPNLTHLQVHMTNFGNDGCRALIDSGALKWLTTLDVGYGNMTDEGAQLLADCPDLKNLQSLDVSRNALTPQGINALQKTGVRVIANAQHPADEEDYLYEVDLE